MRFIQRLIHAELHVQEMPGNRISIRLVPYYDVIYALYRVGFFTPTHAPYGNTATHHRPPNREEALSNIAIKYNQLQEALSKAIAKGIIDRKRADQFMQPIIEDPLTYSGAERLVDNTLPLIRAGKNTEAARLFRKAADLYDGLAASSTGILRAFYFGRAAQYRKNASRLGDVSTSEK